MSVTRRGINSFYTMWGKSLLRLHQSFAEILPSVLKQISFFSTKEL